MQPFYDVGTRIGFMKICLWVYSEVRLCSTNVRKKFCRAKRWEANSWSARCFFLLRCHIIQYCVFSYIDVTKVSVLELRNSIIVYGETNLWRSAQMHIFFGVNECKQFSHLASEAPFQPVVEQLEDTCSKSSFLC